MHSEETMAPRYRNFAEFEREYLRPARRVGQTVEEMIEDKPFEAEFYFDRVDEEEEEEEDY